MTRQLVRGPGVMVKRNLIAALLVAASVTMPAAARATHVYDDDKQTHTFRAPTPCAVVCPHWTGTDDETCLPEPASPAGSWDDHDVVLDPPETTRKIVFFLFHIAPLIEYDAWLCRSERGPNGEWTAGPPGCARGELCSWGDVCGTGGFGCEETREATVCSDLSYPARGDGTCLPRGTPIRLRVYNWLDPAPSIDGTYWYSLTGRL